jgi:hypothetical protein
MNQQSTILIGSQAIALLQNVRHSCWHAAFPLFIDRHLFVAGNFEMASSRGAATEPAAPAEPLIVTVRVAIKMCNSSKSNNESLISKL